VSGLIADAAACAGVGCVVGLKQSPKFPELSRFFQTFKAESNNRNRLEKRLISAGF